jgi:SAM-dependent methyltransferase
MMDPFERGRDMGPRDRLSRIDRDFVDNQSNSPFGRLHWHPCRYPSQIPAAILGLLGGPGAMILDPFCGSGTTAVEAQRLGMAAISIDLNPIACLMTRTKTLTISADEISAIVYRLRENISRALTARELEAAEVPPAVQLTKWYSPGVARDLARIWRSISEENDPIARNIAETCFSSIVLSVCRETRHWGYVCDNTQPKAHREKDCAAELNTRLLLLESAYRDRDNFIKAKFAGHVPLMDSEVICDGAENGLSSLPSSHMDLAVMSPPYFGVTDYIKSQRLTLEWFGHEIEPFRRQEIGARSKRHRKSAILDYHAELITVMREIRRILKPRGYVVLVLGESESRMGVVDVLVTSIVSLGFKVDRQFSRTISQRRRQHPSIQIERVVIFEKGE